MARRNVWTTEETRELLNVIKELELMKSFGEERNNKLYQIAEDELRERGFSNKDAFQIEHKWKNLKRSYYKTRRENYLVESCEFYDELDELMGMKPAPPIAKSKAADQPKRPRAVLENVDLLLSKLTEVDRASNDEFFKKQKDLVNYGFELFTQDERQYTAKLYGMATRNMNDFIMKAQQILQTEGVVQSGTDSEDMKQEETFDETEQDPVRHTTGQHRAVVKKEIVKEFYQTWREEEQL
uniref:Myb/SANT-like DNA-binding domain-containing protein n=1 Tax=Anopheles farauti TaxID=69004 RepID=A0A182Q020_9DIPT